jgi:solute carrier family 27 fatty acid transporter 1/4
LHLNQTEIDVLIFFRWKGENCSTTEVESIIASICCLSVVVFGVEVPFCDGKAGMAVISDPEGKLEIGKLGEELARSLPLYARPLFLRIVKTELDMTGTKKLL